MDGGIEEKWIFRFGEKAEAFRFFEITFEDGPVVIANFRPVLGVRDEWICKILADNLKISQEEAANRVDFPSVRSFYREDGRLTSINGRYQE